MADYLVTDTELTDIADAIRTKGGTSASLEFPDDFISAIGDIATGGDPWSMTWTSTNPTSSSSNATSDGSTYYRTSQNINKTITFTATTNCILVVIAEVVGDAVSPSASLTNSGGTTLRTTDIHGNSYRKLGIYKLSNGDSVSASLSATRGNTMTAYPHGDIIFYSLTAS